MRISVDSLKKVTRAALFAIGVSQEDVEIILQTILFSDQRGISTHGIGRLPLYIEKVRSGHMDQRCDIKTVTDNGAVALLDADNAFGQVAGFRAMEMAIDKAKRFGIAAVGVRNSNNFGTAGFFGNMAVKENMAAFVFANSAPAIAPTGGVGKVFGTNPLCFAFPGTATRDPIILDMATTVVARGKIRLAAKNGEKIPLDWALGPDGNPTDDPDEALKGSLLPIGGYKGYGLSLFVDLFAGLLTGSAFAGGVESLGKMDRDSGNGHFFIALDVNRFMSAGEKEQRIDRVYESVKACGEPGHVFLPGEMEWTRYAENQDSVTISPKQFDEINTAAANLGIMERLKNVEL